MRTNLLLAGVLCCLTTSWAAAQSFDIKPGLWNITSTVQMSGMPPIPNLDQLSPEQRARIEGAMKNMGGSTTTVKSCVTRESIDKAIASASSNKNSTCAPKLVSMSPSRVEMHIDCSQQKSEMKSMGDLTIERQDAEHFKGTGAFKTAGANGRSMDMKWSMSGTFVSSDCGNVKPSGQ